MNIRTKPLGTWPVSGYNAMRFGPSAMPKKRMFPKTKRDISDIGDVYTWVALCADSKLALSWFVGRRDAISAKYFMEDVAKRLKNRIQLTTDGHRVYLDAVERAFGADIDFAQLIKTGIMLLKKQINFLGFYTLIPCSNFSISPGSACI